MFIRTNDKLKLVRVGAAVAEGTKKDKRNVPLSSLVLRAYPTIVSPAMIGAARETWAIIFTLGVLNSPNTLRDPFLENKR